jgi:hypothetical protein
MVRSGLFFLGSLAIVACSDHSPAPVGAALDAPARILASTPTSDSRAQVTIPGSDGNIKISVPARGLKLGIHTGATPAIDMLEIPLGGMEISSTTLPPSGLSLRNMVLSIPTSLPVKVEHAQVNAIEMRVGTPLRLTWSKLEGDGTLTELEPVPSEPVELDIQVLLENGVPTAVISAGSTVYVESLAVVDSL